MCPPFGDYNFVVYMELKKKFKLFSSSEELISMFLGLVIVVVIGGLVFSFVQRHKGKTNVPGVTVTQGEENKDNKDSQSNEYIVKKGDNLWKIATAVYGDGYKWTEIAKENKLSNPGLLEKDQKLVLPKIEKKETVASSEKMEVIGDGQTKASGEAKEYIVVKGDNLWKICLANYKDGYKWTKVWEVNKQILKDPSRLEIGMKLTLPVLN